LRPLLRVAVGLLTLAGAWAGVAAPSFAAGPSGAVAPTQELAALLVSHLVHRAPSAGSVAFETISAQRPITAEQTTLPVLSQSTATNGGRWLQVMLPGRPNGLTGWITQQGTRETSTRWHLVVSTSARTLTVYDGGHRTRTFLAVVGKASTPTPVGQFFVEETVLMARGQADGPFALALSARSNVLQHFGGGPGQIAIHGRDGLGGTPGTAESHGCIRLLTADITWLADRIGPGVPVTIT
jgi:lipoprotein-anchoring transpeptidase ErfK/SrfK